MTPALDTTCVCISKPSRFRYVIHSNRAMASDEVLKWFKGEIDPVLIGSTKQIKDYRDWTAIEIRGVRARPRPK